MMKTILLISHGAALGGSPISALNIARHIDQSQFTPILAFGEEGPIVERAKEEGFKTYIVKKSGFLGIPMMSAYLKILIQEKIDLVHLNTLTSYYKYPAIAAKLLRKPVVWFVRENPEEKRCVRLKHYLNFIASKIVTVSKDTAAHMPYANGGKVMTIYNGIDTSEFAPLEPEKRVYEELGLQPGLRYITTIASLEERKGILDLIEAFHKVHLRFPEYRLLIVGEDRSKKQEYLQKLHACITTNRLEEKVLLYGRSSQIQEIMAISELFVLPSYWEGMSRVLLEAMACGKPCVVSRAGGNPEQIIEGENGMVYASGDSDDLADKLYAILTSGKLEIMGATSRQFAEERFHISQTTKQIEDLYAAIL